MRMCPVPVEAQPALCQTASQTILTPRPDDMSHQKTKERSWKQIHTALFFENLGDCFDVQHLPALIKTARRANPMWHVRRRALRTCRELRQS
jgi:hypothetical protein